MAHDEPLNRRIRSVLSQKREFEERNMFGGICFLINGNMICGADSKNGLMLRVGPDQYDAVLKLEHTREMDFTGRPMKGFVFVEKAGYANDAQLEAWLDKALDFAGKLPPKKKR